jgi:riboflavin biosynthesis pyrimidine reductase
VHVCVPSSSWRTCQAAPATPHARAGTDRARPARAGGRLIATTADPATSGDVPAPLDVLLEAPEFGTAIRGGVPPDPLARRYGGPLAIPLRADRPTVLVNFVESLDGVVALGSSPRGGGSDISGASEPDRFVMALLRTLADAVVVGAGTLRAAPHHEWTPRAVAPRWAQACAAWRTEMGLAPQPTTVVVSASGEVPAAHPGLSGEGVPAVIATTAAGARRIAERGVPGRARVEVLAEGRAVEPAALLDLLARRGTRIALCEGGPHLLGDLLAAGAVDELFLTLAPHLLGRGSGEGRLGLVEGRVWPPAAAPWASLRSVRRAGSHLFLRYACDGRRAVPEP